DPEMHRLAGHDATGPDQLLVGELEAGRVRLHGGAVEQHGRHPPELDPVAGHEAGVPREVALLLAARHAEVGLADDDFVVCVDGDDGWADLDLHGTSMARTRPSVLSGGGHRRTSVDGPGAFQS